MIDWTEHTQKQMAAIETQYANCMLMDSAELVDSLHEIVDLFNRTIIPPPRFGTVTGLADAATWSDQPLHYLITTEAPMGLWNDCKADPDVLVLPSQALHHALVAASVAAGLPYILNPPKDHQTALFSRVTGSIWYPVIIPEARWAMLITTKIPAWYPGADFTPFMRRKDGELVCPMLQLHRWIPIIESDMGVGTS